jgi:hypothetical protein
MAIRGKHPKPHIKHTLLHLTIFDLKKSGEITSPSSRVRSHRRSALGLGIVVDMVDTVVVEERTLAVESYRCLGVGTDTDSRLVLV